MLKDRIRPRANDHWKDAHHFTSYTAFSHANNFLLKAIGGGGSVLGGMSSASGSASSGALPTADPIEKPKPKRIAKGGGMKLGGKKTGVDSFVDKLESEGVHVSSNASKSIKETAKAVTPSVLERLPSSI